MNTREYWGLVLHRAAGRITRLVWVRTLWTDSFLFIAGFVGFLSWKGWSAAVSEWHVFIAFTLVPAVLLTLGVAIYHLLSVPPDMHAEQSKEIAELRAEVHALKNPPAPSAVNAAAAALRAIAHTCFTQAQSHPANEQANGIVTQLLNEIAAVIDVTLIDDFRARTAGRLLHILDDSRSGELVGVVVDADGTAALKQLAGWIESVIPTLRLENLNPSYIANQVNSPPSSDV